jgi:hypothetical protein
MSLIKDHAFTPPVIARERPAVALSENNSKIQIGPFYPEVCDIPEPSSWDFLKWAKNPQKLFFLIVLLAILAVTLQFIISPSIDFTYHRLGYKSIGN